MLFVGGIVAAVLAAFIAYLALSPTSSPVMRRAAIAALALVILAVIACGAALLFLFVFRAGAKETGGGDIPLVPQKNGNEDFVPIIIFLAALFVTLVAVIVLAVREQREKRHGGPR